MLLMLCYGKLLSQMFQIFLSLLGLFFLQVIVIRLAVERIRIEKLSFACRKTQCYSFSVWRHTKDGTIKDLVLSSAPCCLSFSLQPLFITLKSLCKTEDKAVLAHFSVYEKSNFLQNLAVYQTFLSNNSDSCSEYRLKCVKAKYAKQDSFSEHTGFFRYFQITLLKEDRVLVVCITTSTKY